MQVSSKADQSPLFVQLGGLMGAFLLGLSLPCCGEVRHKPECQMDPVVVDWQNSDTAAQLGAVLAYYSSPEAIMRGKGFSVEFILASELTNREPNLIPSSALFQAYPSGLVIDLEAALGEESSVDGGAISFVEKPRYSPSDEGLWIRISMPVASADADSALVYAYEGKGSDAWQLVALALDDVASRWKVISRTVLLIY